MDPPWQTQSCLGHSIHPGHAICYSSKLLSKQFHGFIFSVYKIIKIKFPIIHFHILNCEVKLINGMIYLTFNINIPHILKNDDILLDNPCTKHHKNEGDCTQFNYKQIKKTFVCTTLRVHVVTVYHSMGINIYFSFTNCNDVL